MGDDSCSVLRSELGDMTNFELDNIINSWDSNESAFGNLVGTVWTFDKEVYEHINAFKSIKSETNFNRYNKLQILSDKILISNLSTGFRDTEAGTTRGCSAGYIQLKYAVEQNNTVFLDNTENNMQEFKIRLLSDTDDTPGDSNLWVKVTVDPILSEDTNYQNLPNKANIRTNSNEPIQGLKLKIEINFKIRDCSTAGATNRLSSQNNKISYWDRIKIRNSCSINNSLLSNHAVLAKCLKYKAGNYSENIKDIYHNLIVTSAKSKNIIRSDNFNGESCSARDATAFNICNNENPNTIKATTETCAQKLNCEWDNTFENSMGNKDTSTCPGEGTKCLLNHLDSTENSIKSIKNSISLYYAYNQHRNPYTDEISDYGNECDADTINEIENICIDKNIGISFRFEPVSCTPGHPQFNRETCLSNCDEDDDCTSPVLVSEPDLSPFKCTLEGLNQLEKYCMDVNNSFKNNGNLLNLGYTEEQLKLPGYDSNNYPYTGCNTATVESHLMYIQSLLINKLYKINQDINQVIENDATRLNEYAQSKLNRMEVLNSNIRKTSNEIIKINNNVLALARKIGQTNNDYKRIKDNIVTFNNYLDLRFERKQREFKFSIFFSFVIINILFFLIFFRKK